jgi:predicted RND superfamily exporter protein
MTLGSATGPETPQSTGRAGENRVARLTRGLARECAKRARAILVVSWVVAAVAAGFTSRLSVHGAFHDLLPPDAEAVRHLKELERRTRVLADYMIGVEAKDPELRSRAGDALSQRLAKLDPALVAGITSDRRVEHDFAWKNRYLFAPRDELIAARDGLNHELIKANPLVEDLEDDPPGDAKGQPTFTKLEERLEKAEKEAKDVDPFVSKDGLLQLFVVRTTFTSDDDTRGAALTRLLTEATGAVQKEFPGITIGMTGDVITSNAEHTALLTGMVASTAITVFLVIAALLAFYRSVAAVGALCWALTVGVLVTFAYSYLTVGHLNIASAFLSSIVIGNGINFGLVYLARYLQEIRESGASVEAIARAAGQTATGTLTAALTATVAYGSLVLTPFRGFRDFGIIGGAGMIFCWLASYTILPAGLAWLGARVHGRSGDTLGRLLVRIVPERPRVVAFVGLTLLAVSGAAAIRYLTHDPLEDDLRNLRSYTATLDEAGRWMHKFDEAFGSGISGGFAIGVREQSQAPSVIAALQAVDDGKSKHEHLFSRVSSIDDLLPSDQPEKLALLAEIRTALDSPAMKHMKDDERKRAQELRPPDDLRALTEADVPFELCWPYVERDGSRGRLILANTGWGVDTWSVRSLEHFAQVVRGLRLPHDVVIGGSAFVFSDMLAAMERDGPLTTAAALLGSALVVVLLLGFGRHARVTIACAALGTMSMLSAAWALGIKVNFLDFIALPITVGIGVDYAANIAARARASGGERAGREAMVATGPVVVLCSYTTVVGYASLLFSSNRGIHTFGLSAMIGELTCVTSAVLLAPALIDWRTGHGHASKERSEVPPRTAATLPQR